MPCRRRSPGRGRWPSSARWASTGPSRPPRSSPTRTPRSSAPSSPPPPSPRPRTRGSPAPSPSPPPPRTRTIRSTAARWRPWPRPSAWRARAPRRGIRRCSSASSAPRTSPLRASILNWMLKRRY